MLRVAGCNIRQRADGHWISIGNARPRLGLWRQRAEESDSRFADALQFGQQVVHTARIGMRFADVIVLLETAQLAGIATRKAQRAVRHDPLGVAQVSEHLFDTPLPRRWRRSGSLVGNPNQQLPIFSKLLGEEIEDRAFGNRSEE